MPRRLVGSVALIIGAVLTGCADRASDSPPIRKGTSLTLYEGLPHPMYADPETIAEEKRTKPTIELHGYPFYRDTLSLKTGDEAALNSILNDTRTFGPFSGEKKCGGFHPDYAIAWSVDGKAYEVLICFGCSEFKRFGPTGSERFDIAGNAYERLKGLLVPYRKNRPIDALSGP